MPQEPQITVLPYYKRTIIFWLFFVIFVVAMPALIFYTSGNRLSFDEDKTNIIAMGGINLSNELTDIELYLNEEPVEKTRSFFRALYVGNIESGVHQIHVQSEGLQTWVKRLPVYPHIVTDSFSFNLPVRPQVRLITPYQTATGTAVILDTASSSEVLPFASTTNPFFATTTTATSTFAANSEFTFVSDLFATSTATSSETLLEIVSEGLDTVLNTATTSATSTEVATTTKAVGDAILFQRGEEVIATWVGDQSDIPHYYCIDYVDASTTIAEYGEHVFAAIASSFPTTTDIESVDPQEICRNEIRVDRTWQTVKYFDFYQSNRGLVLLHLDDGLFVTEVDDRSWQNTQLLYPGRDIDVRVDGGRIYVQDGPYLVEVLTSLE